MKILKITLVTFIFTIISFCFIPVINADKLDNIDNLQYENYDADNEKNIVSCGTTKNSSKALIEDIPASIPKILSIIYFVIQVAVPILLVIFGMLDLFKGLTAQKDDEIKKGQQLFLKRLLAAALIFFVLMIVKLLIGIVADSNKNAIVDCAECFIKNDCN